MLVQAAAPATSIAMVIEYDGTRYHGSQVQASALTVQGEIEKALYKLTGENIRIKTASRTDAGVHARGQVVTFRTDTVLPADTFVRALNHFLPDDIAVRSAHEVTGSFDARRHAVSREYRYYMHTSPTRSPLREGFSWRVQGPLDIDAMNRACRLLIGIHDFASFVSSPLTAREKTTVREINKAEITHDGEEIVLEIVARSFLPHQVRTTVGTLVRVGRGELTVDDFRAMLEAGTPGLAGPMAPAGGLCLVRVNYHTPFKGEAR
jgi:tRNA pseudouridine38-40 synthase